MQRVSTSIEGSVEFALPVPDESLGIGELHIATYSWQG